MKLLHLDIETSPAVVQVWSLFNQNISVDQIIKPTSVLCFTAKWHGSKELLYHKSTHQAGREFDKMIRAAHRLLSEADAVCHYNGCSFDIPRLNQEFLKAGMPPPPTIPQIDLKKVVMSKFGMVSSKLAFVGPYLKIGEKVRNEGWPLWDGCLKGDADAWTKMEEYNKGDVLLLERLYIKVLPWIENHPNMNLYVDDVDPVCPNCGSPRLQSRGEHKAATYIYARYHCQECGRWCRARGRKKTTMVADRR